MMKTLSVSLSILVLLPAQASALGGKLRSPRIGHRAEITTSQKENVRSLLQYMRSDLKFISGSFVNEFSNQRFGGTSAKASHFIGMLRTTGLWDVEVTFRDFEEQQSAFTLHQDSSDTISVIVNSGRNDFLLKDFSSHLPRPGYHWRVRNAIHAKEEQKGPHQPASESRSEGHQQPLPESGKPSF